MQRFDIDIILASLILSHLQIRVNDSVINVVILGLRLASVILLHSASWLHWLRMYVIIYKYIYYIYINIYLLYIIYIYYNLSIYGFNNF